MTLDEMQNGNVTSLKTNSQNHNLQMDKTNLTNERNLHQNNNNINNNVNNLNNSQQHSKQVRIILISIACNFQFKNEK